MFNLLILNGLAELRQRILQECFILPVALKNSVNSFMLVFLTVKWQKEKIYPENTL